MILHYDTYTYGDGIIAFYNNGIVVKDMVYRTNTELTEIVNEEAEL